MSIMTRIRCSGKILIINYNDDVFNSQANVLFTKNFIASILRETPLMRSAPKCSQAD